MKNLLVYGLGGATVIATFLYMKKKKGHAELSAVAAATTAALPSGTKETVAANNSTGSINYSPVSQIAGFNVPIKTIAVPKAAPGSVTYPPATTVTDPRNMSGTVASFQNAAPIPSNFYYYPAAGDMWGILAARLGGTPLVRMVDPKNNSSIPLAMLPLADVGKLNGFVSLKDVDVWLKAMKPIRLPVGGWNDVSGPTPGAMGSIK